MKKLIILTLLPFVLFAQKNATIKGTIKNKFGNAIENVNISFKNKGTTSDKSGNYSLKIPINKTVTITFSHVSYQPITKQITVSNIKTVEFSPKLSFKNEEIEEIEIKNTKKQAQGISEINTQKVKNIIGANPGVENVLMTLPGVSNNNELSTQYNVRGGNFDENLVYVNGIEVYRPFLIRSGQQEGLSFINSQMIKNISFSAGGFQAKYGDKLASVLDISYRKPQKFQTQIDLSLLGASATIENTFLNKKLAAIIGFRYRDNSLFVNSKQTQISFKPRFTDVQTFLTYKLSNNFTMSFLGNFSLNKYNYKPIARKTRFGTVANPLELIVYYNGQEKDSFQTLFGAVSADYKASENLKITTTVSSFNTQESEHYDIVAAYNLGKVDTSIGSENFGNVEFSKGIGSQLNHARNNLDALISNIKIKATLKDKNNEWIAGVKYQTENIKDQIKEWEQIDSLGFSVRPPIIKTPNHQPYKTYKGSIVPYQNIKSKNEVDINRISGFLQFSRKDFIGDHQVWINLGIRLQNWSVNALGFSSKKHIIASPRVQFAFKPYGKRDILFQIAGGFYSQAPFYKELRDYKGNLHPEVKAQKSTHLVFGSDYSFSLWERPFKLTSELYYKKLFDINSYSVDNVKIRYKADNKTEGYAYGFDLRINGEFVPGNDSWFSFGYLKTEENINGQGYIARPTDQRLKFGILFQDYVPALPDFKAYLNLVYNTGVPGGSPAYTNVYEYQNRLDDYKRADLGVSYIFADINKTNKRSFIKYFKELSAGLELFNIFDIKNSITNTWVRDAHSKRHYGIPNYMTGRVWNVNLKMKF